MNWIRRVGDWELLRSFGHACHGFLRRSFAGGCLGEVTVTQNANQASA